MKRYTFTIVIIVLATIILIAISRFYILKKKANNNIMIQNANTAVVNNPLPIQSNATSNVPLSNALSRITKKPFGIFVSPHNSPVSPERFTGYHTGTDFETTPEEANASVEVKAITDGTIINKLSVSGYGGVILEKAEIENQAVIILYGHVDIRPQNSHLAIGDSIKKNDSIAILAPGYSPESGGERKHLHLGIIKGNKIDYRGYVQNSNELSIWINANLIL